MAGDAKLSRLLRAPAATDYLSEVVELGSRWTRPRAGATRELPRPTTVLTVTKQALHQEVPAEAAGHLRPEEAPKIGWRGMSSLGDRERTVSKRGKSSSEQEEGRGRRTIKKETRRRGGGRKAGRPALLVVSLGVVWEQSAVRGEGKWGDERPKVGTIR